MTMEERATCPVCCSTGGTMVLRCAFDADPIRAYLLDFYGGRLDPTDLAGSDYELRSCPTCGLVYQRWIPDAEGLAHLYGTIAVADAEEVGARRGLDVRLGYVDEVERAVRHFGGRPAEVEVLDYGAGTGGWLAVASALGCRATGAELDEAVVDRLREGGHQVIAASDLPSERFHFINTEQVFEHLADPRETARRLFDALRPGGVLRISVPNGGDIVRRLATGDWSAPKSSADSLNAVAPLEHLNCFNHESLLRLGAEAGLERFAFPLRTQLHQRARLRPAASSVLHRVRPPAGTLLHFRRPVRPGIDT